MARVGRPFGGRQREEARRTQRMRRADNPTPERKNFSFSVPVGSDLHQRLKAMKGRRSENIRTMLEEYGSLKKEVTELRRINRQLSDERKEWEKAWKLDQHALGQHFDAPVRGCAACEEN